MKTAMKETGNGMIIFSNGLIINGNPKILKTIFGIVITNNLGLNLEISDSVWKSLNQNK
jgi:hypothetical protein